MAKGHKTRGLYAARKLIIRRRKFRWAKKDLFKYATGLWKKIDPLEGAPLARGIVIAKTEVEVKSPHSGRRKCVKVQLIKNGRVVTAYCPGPGCIKIINEHDEVIIERMRAPQGRSKGDIPGVKYRVVMVQGVPIKEILAGKKQKPTR